MNPDFEVRLKSIVKTLEQVVLLAIPQANSLALEQANVAIGHLEMLRAQWMHAANYARLCLSHSRALAQDLVDHLGGRERELLQLADLHEQLRQAVPPTGLPTDQVWTMRNRLVFAIDAVIDAVAMAGDALARDVDPIILSHALKEHERERSWFRATGLDPDGGALPTIEEMVRPLATD